ncbi:hypothetical protein NSQ77_02595 [Oceanobacillus sp. FSL K6-2867]|uniref:hypothetical protein n=1 Tax=Oceanobacillus sp. FSL K6-2867 TaxID=2954748 RepID=UPI0030DC0E32
MKFRILVICVVIIPLMGACSTEKNSSTEQQNSKEYSLENVYQWLEESNLLDGEREDVTKNHTDDYEGITQATSIGDIIIFEFEEKEDTIQFEGIPFAVSKENIGVFVLGFSSEIEGVQEVLDAREPIEGLHKGYYLSAEQQNFVESMRNDELTNLQDFSDKFYSFDEDTQRDTFNRFLYGEQFALEGVVVKSSPELVIYGDENYNNENWESIQSEHTQMLPYIVEAENVYVMTASEQKRFERGDPITVRGTIFQQGSMDEEKHWKLFNVFILE